jgi:hypothetical protein
MNYRDRVPGSNPAPPNWPDAANADGTYNGLMLRPDQMVADTDRGIDARHTQAPVEQRPSTEALK